MQPRIVYFFLMFQFKQFAIHDEQCAMKVGTDGVLLGAWAFPPIPSGETAEQPPLLRCLDIGTGSGLIALMLAQRFPTAQIDAVEIVAQAAQQAQENVEASPFSERVRIFADDFQHFAAYRTAQEATEQYQLIVSNPPFFRQSLLAPEAARARARHCESGLDFHSLAQGAAALLSEEGHFQLILPAEAQTSFCRACASVNLFLQACTAVQTVAHKAPKRVLLSFGKNDGSPQQQLLCLSEAGKRSQAYQTLCQDFYL